MNSFFEIFGKRGLAVCAGTALMVVVQAQQYTVTILDRPGAGRSQGVGIDGTSQVGNLIPSGEFNFRPMLWHGSAASVVDLTPPNCQYSYVSAVHGQRQVGRAEFGTMHAVIWSGTAASAIDLQPQNWYGSEALGMSEDTQVGYVEAPALDRPYFGAVLWHGTRASARYLQPPGYTDSQALGVSGTTQVGWGSYADQSRRALLWHGSAASAVDLTPPGFFDVTARAVSGNEQVGEGYSRLNGYTRALLWSGSAASVQDLHPVGYHSSKLAATNGNAQVGESRATSSPLSAHAMVWRGTASSAVDINPAGFLRSSATGISANGDIIGTGVSAAGYESAILWRAVPEPNSIAFLAIGTVWMLRRRGS